MSHHRIRCCYLLLALVLVLPVTAQAEHPSLSPSLTSNVAELDLFERFAFELEGSSDASIVRLGEKALAMVQAFAMEDGEGFVAAKAVFDLRWNRLSTEQAKRLSRIYASMRQDWERTDFLAKDVWPDGGLGLGFNGGCEAQVICQDNSVLSCECITPPQSHGDCYFSVISNGGYPGRVSCDCDGGGTTTKICTSSPGCDSWQCNQSCGPPGGVCTSSGCVCI